MRHSLKPHRRVYLHPELYPVWHHFGFDGPFSGGHHQFMSRGEIDVRVPNPHDGDISIDLLKRILEQAGVKRDEWLEN